MLVLVPEFLSFRNCFITNLDEQCIFEGKTEPYAALRASLRADLQYLGHVDEKLRYFSDSAKGACRSTVAPIVYQNI